MNTYVIKSFSLRLLHDEISKIVGNAENIVSFNYIDIKVNEIIEECSYYSLLNEDKIVIVYDFKFNADADILSDYIIKSENNKTKLILVVNNIDKRLNSYKKIKSFIQLIEIEELKSNELSQKISNYAKKIGLTISYGAINKLLLDNQNNYDLVLSELEKFKIIKSEINELDVEEYGARLDSDDTFLLSDAIVNKEYDKILPLFDSFVRNKSEVVPFVSLLASSYRLIYLTMNYPKYLELADILKVHPYRIKLAKEKTRKYTKKELEDILLKLGELDYKLKSTGIDGYSLLKLFLIEIN